MRFIAILLVLICGVAYGDAGDVNVEQIANRVWDSTSNEIKIIDTNRTMGGYKITLTPGEIPTQLSADTSISWVRVKATTGNTDNIYVAGHATLSTDDSYYLDADQEVDIKVDNLTDVYIYSPISGDSVSIIYTVK